MWRNGNRFHVFGQLLVRKIYLPENLGHQPVVLENHNAEANRIVKLGSIGQGPKEDTDKIMELLRGNSAKFKPKTLRVGLNKKIASTGQVPWRSAACGQIKLAVLWQQNLRKYFAKLRSRYWSLLRLERLAYSSGGAATPNLDDLVEYEELGTRVLQLQWKDSDHTWLLIEDRRVFSTSESSDSSSSFETGGPSGQSRPPPIDLRGQDTRDFAAR